MTLLGILFLVVALLVSVGIHELGHLVPAKRFGVKVSQYFIGFGPNTESNSFPSAASCASPECSPREGPTAGRRTAGAA